MWGQDEDGRRARPTVGIGRQKIARGIGMGRISLVEHAAKRLVILLQNFFTLYRISLWLGILGILRRAAVI